MEKVRKNGYAIDDEECEIGHRCISVPVYDYTGNVIAAISLSDITEKMSAERMKGELLPAMLEASKQISYRLGFCEKS